MVEEDEQVLERSARRQHANSALRRTLKLCLLFVSAIRYSAKNKKAASIEGAADIACDGDARRLHLDGEVVASVSKEPPTKRVSCSNDGPRGDRSRDCSEVHLSGERTENR